MIVSCCGGVRRSLKALFVYKLSFFCWTNLCSSVDNEYSLCCPARRSASASETGVGESGAKTYQAQLYNGGHVETVPTAQCDFRVVFTAVHKHRELSPSVGAVCRERRPVRFDVSFL